jgi:hypothetical protein
VSDAGSDVIATVIPNAIAAWRHLVMGVILTRKDVEHSYAAMASFVSRVGQTQLERAAAGTEKK